MYSQHIAEIFDLRILPVFKHTTLAGNDCRMKVLCAITMLPFPTFNFKTADQLKKKKYGDYNTRGVKSTNCQFHAISSTKNNMAGARAYEVGL